MVARACRRIDEAIDGAPGSNELAKEAELSTWHFQRLFKRIAGVSPKQYATASRMRRFRFELRTSNGSVTDAIYDAGFGSASRAYEAVSDRLGMTPSVYRNGAEGEAIRYALARGSLGWR